MAAPLYPIHRLRNDVYADDVPHCMYRSYHDYIYEEVIAQHPADPVGYRRLVHRDFTNIRGVFVCVEHTVARVAANGRQSDWSHDVIVFRTGTVPPVRWNENNMPVRDLIDPADIVDVNTQSSSLLLFMAQEASRAELDNEERMHRAQDALSCIPADAE